MCAEDTHTEHGNKRCVMPIRSIYIVYIRVSDLYLALHGIRVQLAHVAASVVLGHRLHVQIPRVCVRVRHADARIVRDDVLVNRLDRLGVRLDPADLVL